MFNFAQAADLLTIVVIIGLVILGCLFIFYKYIRNKYRDERRYGSHPFSGFESKPYRGSGSMSSGKLGSRPSGGLGSKSYPWKDELGSVEEELDKIEAEYKKMEAENTPTLVPNFQCPNCKSFSVMKEPLSMRYKCLSCGWEKSTSY